MLADLIAYAARFGLQVHESKTKLCWNGQGNGTLSSDIRIRRKSFEVLGPSAATMYLGRLFSFGQTHDREIQNRVNKAWAKFAVFRDEFTNRHYSLDKRVTLFHSMVLPSLLYGCARWTMTKKSEAQIRTVQRKMM